MSPGVNLDQSLIVVPALRTVSAHAVTPGSEIPKVRVRLNVKIIKQPRQEIIASQNFERVVDAKGSTVNDVVLAFDDALGKVLRRVVEWTLVTANESAEQIRLRTRLP